ncbi:HlyD family efflux transporter periplasmic adaptor subunit [Plantibacter sp. VKM Ac-2880]|uniref:efflux RND transporter periplasmic adaptor subunit n=1 Tax=Plantibacter sp. VKM Ac-2880 TaxID=2783827 RepID=UPI00188EDA78|nr:HlyD family efflux transporter periplasmic adaptor subunit [Plantibacter sp. VKM Ac-2880]MBF4570867.1 HlyD family efflux transporter periplasmic adaptor subunit [Plantibacter sp. VKM Ac-2880]
MPSITSSDPEQVPGLLDDIDHDVASGEDHAASSLDGANRRRKSWLVASSAAVVLIVVSLVAVFFNPFARAPEEQVATATVTTGTVTTTVEAKGSITAASTSNVAFANPGTITGIAVSIGQTVAAGQELATVDPADADRALQKAQSALSAAETALSNVRASYSAASNALDDARAVLASTPADAPEYAANAASLRDQESALPLKDTEVVNAVMVRDDAAREVEAAKAERDKTVLKAPIAGVVTAINATVGSVTAGGGSSSSSTAADPAEGSGSSVSAAPSGLITISDVSSLFVSASVAEADIGQVALTQAAKVTLASDASVVLDGTVVSIAPTPQTNAAGVVSYAAVIQLAGPPPTVKLGQTAFVSIVTASSADVPTLPATAVTVTAPGTGTVLLAPKTAGTAGKTIPVKVGLSGGGVIEITDGLKDGDVVQLTMPPADDTGGMTDGSSFE